MSDSEPSALAVAEEPAAAESSAASAPAADALLLGQTASGSPDLAGFVPLSQYPELPTGCEVTSLAAVLNFYGYPVSKTELADSYLAKGPVGEVSFYEAFEGDPRDGDSYGCYAPVIVNAANAYLAAVGSTQRAVDLTGAAPSELYARIDAGRPVIVWATRYMEVGHYSVTWYVDGQELTWFTPEHCLVLVGYSNAEGTVDLADPLEGAVVTYDKALFEQRYASLNSQAVEIEGEA